MRRNALLKIVALILCIILCICPLCACKTADGGKTVYWLLSSSPKNLDPQTAKDESELQIIKNCFVGLLEKNAEGEIVSAAAESYSVSGDGLKYTFKLNEQNYWCTAQGRSIKKYAPVTAHDFIFAIKRLFTDNPNADVMNILKSIKGADAVLTGGKISKLGVSAPDDYTLVITLSQKNSALPEAFTSPELFPCNEEFFTSTSGRYGLNRDNLLFNGEFCLSSWGESSIKLIANDKFSGKKAQVSALLFYQPKSTREHTALLKEGEIDAALLSCEQYDALQSRDNFVIDEYTATVWTMVLNPSHELWQNEDLRRAVILCTDRNAIKDEGHHRSTDLLVDDSAQVFSQNYRELAGYPATKKYDPDTAKALYSAALSSLELSQIYNSEILIADSSICKENFAALNQIYQRELSLYFSPTYLSESALISRVKSGDFAAALIPLEVSYNTPSCILGYFDEGSPSCLFGVQNEIFKKDFAAAQSALSAAQSARLFKSAEQALYDTYSVSPLFFENGYFVSSKATSGYYIDAEGSVIFKSVKKK